MAHLKWTHSLLLNYIYNTRVLFLTLLPLSPYIITLKNIINWIICSSLQQFALCIMHSVYSPIP